MHRSSGRRFGRKQGKRRPARRDDLYRMQSAMEYLMTYGWAILVIAVVLGVLFQLGVFGGANLAPKATPGSCEVQHTTAGASLAGMCQGEMPQYVASFPVQNCISGSAFSGAWATVQSIEGLQSSVTVSAWVNDRGYETVHMQGVLGNEQLNTFQAPGFQLALNWGEYNAIFIVDGNYITNIGSAPSISIDKWYMVSGTYNSTTGEMALYLDDTLYSSNTVNTGAVTSSGPYVLGADAWSVLSPGVYCDIFNGTIANVQLYNTSLSSSEINALYQEGIGGAPVRPQNIVGWWPLNSNANDYSGSNNNGQANDIGYTSFWTNGYTAP